MLATAIALPTISVTLSDKIYQIRGIEPSDISANLVIDNFSYDSALDLQGGTSVTYRVNIDKNLSEEEKQQKFEETRLIIATRMAKIGLTDFEFTSFINREDNIYELVLTTPKPVEDNLVQVLVSPGVLDVLMSAPETPEGEEEPSPDENTLFPGTTSSGITNSDIAGMAVISDSRIYTDDPENPNNFGIEAYFTDAGSEKLSAAILANATSNIPLIFTLDSSLVAVQASGQQITSLTSLDSLLLYTYFADTRLNNSVLAAVMSSPSLETPVDIQSTTQIAPTLGVNALRNIKYASFAGVAIVYLVLLVIQRQKGLYVVVTAEVFAILLIALQKLTSMNLSLAVICGFFTIFSIFVLSQTRLINKISKLDSPKLTKDFIDQHSLNVWGVAVRLFILVPFIFFFENLLTVSVNQFAQSVLAGMVIWFLFRFLFMKPITSIFVRSR